MEHFTENSTLIIPNDLLYLPAIQGFILEIANKIGFNERATMMILIAVEEAVSNVVKHAFEPNEKATFQVTVSPGNTGITIIIKDKGLPYSPNLVPEYSAPSDVNDTSRPGLGTHLMKKAVDQIIFRNLGREGKELHLIKYLPYQSVQDMNTASELEGFPEPVNATPVETKPFSVRLIQPSEVYDVSKLFYRAYGYTYSIDTIYYPEKLAEHHAEGKIISVVTVGQGRGIVGHAALVRDRKESRIAEAAMAVVEPTYRNQGCYNTMIEYLVEEARRANLAGIFSKAVTNHVYAQKAGQKAGFKRCAVVVGLIPADRSFKGIHAVLNQRESVTYGYLSVNDPGDIILFPPHRHREIIDKTYASLGLKRNFRESSGEGWETGEEPENVTVAVIPGYSRAVIEVEKYGQQTVLHIQNILRTLCYQKIEQITLCLNLADPATHYVAVKCENMGFFYAGILPFSHIRDALLLQYLNNVSIEYDEIHVACEMGRCILEYVKSCDPNNCRPDLPRYITPII